MRRVVRATGLAAALLLPLLLSGTALAAGITVTSPNGGESWQTGTTQTIRWTYTGSLRSTLFIQLLKNGALNQTISSSAPSGSGGSGSFSWTIPAAQALGPDYQIRVLGFDAANMALASDLSDANFSIVSTPANSITVTSPNGGESWRPGTTHSVSWSFSGSPGADLRIELLKGGALDSTLSASTPLGSGGSGSFSWGILANQANGNDYGVRVSSNSTSATDSSNANFTVDNSFTLTVSKSGTGSGTVTSSPGGINCGSACSAAFASGSQVTLTAASSANNTFDGWTGDCSGTGSCVVTLDADRSVGAGFTGPPTGITVTTPNGGQTWTASSIQTLRWSYTGSPGTMVRVELLKGGVLNRTISASSSVGSAGSGSLNWMIPSTQALGADYRIRVTSTSNAAFTDTSDADFRINRTGIAVTSPNGGESWNTNTTQTVRWIYSGSVGTMVRVELLKSGVINKTLTSSTSIGSGGSGQFSWAVPSNQTAGADYKIRVTSTSSSMFTDSSDANFTINSAPTSISVSPASATLTTGQPQQFTATATGGSNSVTWSVNDVAGGNATLGTVSASGLYAAPALPPSPSNLVTVKATSTIDTSKSGSATVTVNNPVPAITSISPTSLNAGSGDTTLTVNGSGFNAQSVVMLGANNLATTFVNGGQLTAVAPAASLATAGPLAVTVVAPAPGGGTSNSNNLTVLLVVGVSPGSASLLTGGTQQFTSTVTGGANSVTWSVNNVAGGNATVGTIDASGLYTAPAVSPSPNTVTVKATSTADSSRSAAASVAVSNPAPAITSISPTSLDAGSGDTTLTVNGSGFNPQSTAKLGSTSLTTTFVNSGQLTAVAPAASLATAGTLAVTVVTPAPGGGTSNSNNLAVLLVLGVSPGSASLLTGGTQQFTSTVTGGANSVTWSVNDVGGGNSTVGTIDASGLYTAPAVPPSPNTVTVKATSTADINRNATASMAVSNPAPTLSSISPTSLNAGIGDTTLTVNGSGFNAQSVVMLGANSLATTFVNGGQLTAVAPAASLATAGTFAVTVVTPSPGGGTSNGNNLQVLLVVGVSPGSASLLTGGTQQFTSTVTGGANSVAWSVNDVAGGNATVGTIDAGGLYTAPAVPPSPNTVTVKATSTADTSRSATASATVSNPAPAISSISPTSLNAGIGDTTLTVYGSGFNAQSVVMLGANNLATTFVNGGQLTAVAPAASLATAGTLAVTVVTPAPGGGTSNGNNLQVLLVVGVSPGSASLLTGGTQQFTSTVTGGGNSVTWSVNDVAGGNSTVGTIDASGLYTAPAVPPSPNTVTVKATSTADSSRNATASVTVSNPAPTISSISPTSLNAGSGDTTLTVNGSAFNSLSVVKLGATSLTTTLVNSGQLTAVAPAASLATAGTFAVTVVTPAPGGGTSNSNNLQVMLVVGVSPSSPSVFTGQTQQFTSTVTGGANSVTWSVNDVAGGNATVGTITAGGLYTAPAVPPSPTTVTVKATSTADTSKNATASVTISNAAPSISSISPATVNAGSGNTPLTVNGSGFSALSTVMLGSTSLTTTFVNSGQLTATVPSSSLTSAGTLAISVSTPAPGGGTSTSLNLTVLLVVGISPASANLQTGGTKQFTSTVTGGSNSVSWSVNGVAGGNSTLGTISSGGLYTAPSVPPTPNPVTVTATSTADTSRSASSSVTIGNPAPVLSSISPSSIQALSADTLLTVTGSSFLNGSVIEFAGLDLTTTFGSSTSLSATIPASMLTSPGTIPITVTTPGPGGGVSSARNLTITQSVTVSPSTRTVPVNWTRLFTATVSGGGDQSVTWMVNDVPGGSAATGTITAAGIYISPGSVPGNNVVTVKAVSVANPNKYGTAVVTITLPVSDNYPRADATSILATQPALPQIPLTGTIAAVLDWTAKDSSANNEEVSKPEEVLAVCHNLNEMAIPHIHTTDWNTAKTYPMVAVAGVLEQNSLTSTERSNLATYVQNGGTLLLWRTADTNLLTSLGVTASSTFSGTDKRLVAFNTQTGDGVVKYIDDDVEVNWQMEYWSMGTTREYTTGSATAIAGWTSGKAAIVRSNVGTGRAYIFGWRLKNVMADAELQNIPVNPEPQWTNTQVLDADIARIMMRGIYETLPGSPHVRQMAPNGKQAALILTHDVDARVSYDNLPQYLALENAQGVKSTYLFTTAPYDSGWVETMYTASGKANIQSALDQGFDIQSHSFDHYKDYDDAPYGTGNENALNYLPHYSADLGYTIGYSALGELGVSRWLLRHDFNVEIPAFRSGYLLMPVNFLDAVQQVGYRRDSTYAAGISRGFTPFVPFKMVNGAPTTYRFVEYPMGLEDRNLDATNVTQIVDSWEKVIRTNFKNGVPTVINIHPVNQPRIDAMQLLFQRISDLDIWIGDWKTFGDFYESQGMTCSRWP